MSWGSRRLYTSHLAYFVWSCVRALVKIFRFGGNGGKSEAARGQEGAEREGDGALTSTSTTPRASRADLQENIFYFSPATVAVPVIKEERG